MSRGARVKSLRINSTLLKSEDMELSESCVYSISSGSKNEFKLRNRLVDKA